jgi:hypothetical protein
MKLNNIKQLQEISFISLIIISTSMIFYFYKSSFIIGITIDILGVILLLIVLYSLYKLLLSMKDRDVKRDTLIRVIGLTIPSFFIIFSKFFLLAVFLLNKNI